MWEHRRVRAGEAAPCDCYSCSGVQRGGHTVDGCSCRIHGTELHDQAAASFDAQGNSTGVSTALFNDIDGIISSGLTAASVQAVLEAVVLVIMSAAYMVFLPVCVAMFGRAERMLSRCLSEVEYKTGNVPVFLPAEFSSGQASAASGRNVQIRSDKAKEISMMLPAATAQRRRFVAACSIVLITFITRASLDLLLLLHTFVNVPRNLDCCCCCCCCCCCLLFLLVAVVIVVFVAVAVVGGVAVVGAVVVIVVAVVSVVAVVLYC